MRLTPLIINSGEETTAWQTTAVHRFRRYPMMNYILRKALRILKNSQASVIV
jgi:hypothetical protein